MTMLSIKLIFLSLFIQNQVFSSPVLLWSNANLPETTVSLSTHSPLEIVSNYICKLDSERIDIRLFAVNDLKTEDIQRGSQSSHAILTDAKKEKSLFRYIPNVDDNAYQTFSLIPQSNNMQCAHIHFQMASLDTYQSLEEALNAMQTSINRIETDSKTTTVMVLLSSPIVQQNLVRERRDIEVDEEDVITSDDGDCLFYAEELYWTNSNDTKAKNYSLDIEGSSCKSNALGANGTSTSTILELAWTGDADEQIRTTLIANITGLYWELVSTELRGVQYRYFAYGMYSAMDTPPKYSYACTKATFVKYDKDQHGGKGAYDFDDKFYITHLQFQPFNANGTSFGPPNYCTSFFTSGIWMGITSSLLCLAILLFGIRRMMTIKSNDRFDDPKGKPLVIKAQE